MAPTRRSTLLIAHQALMTAMAAVEAVLEDEPEPKPACAHPKKTDITAMGAKAHKYLCPDCHLEWEGEPL